MAATRLWIWRIREWRTFRLPCSQPHGPLNSCRYVSNYCLNKRPKGKLKGGLTIELVRYLPAWFPAANFAKIAKGYKVRAAAFGDVPYAFVKDQIKRGTFVPSFLSNLLQDNPVEPGTEDEDIIKWSAGSLYAGGADTVRTKICTENPTAY